MTLGKTINYEKQASKAVVEIFFLLGHFLKNVGETVKKNP